MEIKLQRKADTCYIATIKGDRCKPRLEGHGVSWQAAVRDLHDKAAKESKSKRVLTLQPVSNINHAHRKENLMNKTTSKKTTAITIAPPDVSRAEPLGDAEKAILKAIRLNKKKGLLRAEIVERLLPQLTFSTDAISAMLRRLVKANLIRSEGNTKAARWFPVATA